MIEIPYCQPVMLDNDGTLWFWGLVEVSPWFTKGGNPDAGLAYGNSGCCALRHFLEYLHDCRPQP